MNEVTELEDRSYEELVEALEVVLSELEDGGLPLEQAVDAYERGVRLSDQAEKLLSEAELRIEQLRERPTT
ncbi:MAG: exodeoxyribonuclease VII small subunit [Chloroflexi bacterium]|nr:exodeoxyribonuclease VII small subunit [Chloroflexota bacterium]